MTKKDSAFYGVAGIFLFLVLVAPVSAGLILAEDAAEVMSVTGSTSPVFQVMDQPILSGSSVTVDGSLLQYYFASYTIADENIQVTTSASSPVVWTTSIDSSTGMITLTSSSGDISAGDNITITLTGTPSCPWLPNSGYTEFPVTVTRTDTSDSSDFNFTMDTPASSGLAVTDGGTVTAPTGATSPVITLMDSPLAEGYNITIDVAPLDSLFQSGTITDENVEVTSSASSPVVWTRSVSPDGQTLNLTSTGGATNPLETVTVTFRGTEGNQWVPASTIETIHASREDTSGNENINIRLDVPAAGGILAAGGDDILSPKGSTSVVFSITHAPIAKDSTVTINTAALNPYVTGGHLTSANVQVTDMAAAATWTKSVSGNTLRFRSTGGATAVGENFTVIFTGAGSTPWVADTGARTTIPLTAERTDSAGTAAFDVVLDTGGRPNVDFSASPTSAAVPVTVTFTDMSLRAPVEWNWSFGDGTFSELQNPTHTYSSSGLYTIILNATNGRGSTIRSKADYIDVYTTGTNQANTAIEGLTVTNCGGPQTVMVDTTVIPADLIPNQYVLEIQPPSDRGLKNITIYAQNGIGFTRNGNIITGSPTGVHLVSADIAPASGFPADIGPNAEFNWSADLSSYPCNAIVSTSIRERISSANEALLLRTGNANTPPAVLKGTAYSATLTKTNFPSSVPVKIHASIDSDWRTSLDPTSTVFIWRITDGGSSGQILHTYYLSSDSANHLDYYEAASPNGMSTFGLSAFTGNNNPFQLITLAITEYVEESHEKQEAVESSSDIQKKPATTAAITPKVTVTPVNTTPIVTPWSETVTGKINTNQDGVVTQPLTLTSLDGFMTLTIDKGIMAKGADNKPLLSVSLTPVSTANLPGPAPGGTVVFAGRAFEVQPEGATFTPGIVMKFVVPSESQNGQDLTVKMYDHASGTWLDLPTVYDARNGIVTAQVSRFCCFALFEKTPVSQASATTALIQQSMGTPASAPAQSPPATAIDIFSRLIGWLAGAILTNLFIIGGILVLVAAFVLYEKGHWRGG